MHGIERSRSDHREYIIFTFRLDLSNERIETVYRAYRRSMSPERIAATVELIERQLQALIEKDKDRMAKSETALEDYIKTCGKYVKKGTRNPDRYKAKQ